MSDAADLWKQWHEERVAAVSAPHGPLSLAGTHWLDDHPEGRLPAIPGEWRVAGDAIVHNLDGKQTRLAADDTVSLGGRRLVVIAREGLWAVRDFDPAAPTRTAFRGIDAGPYDPRWSVEGRFAPYGTAREIRVENADGKERGLGLAGELSFTLDGQEQVLKVARQGDGRLWAVFADATSGSSTFRFRFLYPQAPDDQGRTTVDLNRAVLPNCAFADHFICPFPPPGNTLSVGVEAGERNLTAARSV
ncbi:DUF1684 domain-containing protein [Streptomyces kunmingensis]|uniref:DUF1684 domain-containing protein n=1 Tax=Streptomyces kunmingensis TaxID=68225 RepID=A0ABU6C9I9_9ACTN|nr:DUF1684 domain-containing protein [Streptomyces kunmingensis]MEB3960721.1 DUF1684 domain-containing protein [Streptomyces kunmingensis]